MVMRVLLLTSQRCVQSFSDDLSLMSEWSAPPRSATRPRHPCHARPQRPLWQSHQVADKHVGAAQRVLLTRARESICNNASANRRQTNGSKVGESRRQQRESFVHARVHVHVISESVAAMLKVSQDHRSEALSPIICRAHRGFTCIHMSVTLMFHSSANTSLNSPTTKSGARNPAMEHERSLAGKACSLIVVTSCKKAAFDARQEQLRTQLKACATTIRNTSSINKNAQQPWEEMAPLMMSRLGGSKAMIICCGFQDIWSGVWVARRPAADSNKHPQRAR